jgi:hypothetical protein
MSDGPLPPPSNDVDNRLNDLRRDLGDVVAGHDEARKDFTDDLMVFVDTGDKPDAIPAIRDFARQITDAVVAAKLPEPKMMPILKNAWTALAARQLSEKQVTALQAEMRTTLTGLGIPDPSAQTITNQVGTVQKAVTDRKRRWYEVF